MPPMSRRKHSCATGWAATRNEGEHGLRDRSSAPHQIPHRTSERRVAAIAALRRVRFTGPEIAELLDMPLSTVSGIPPAGLSSARAAPVLPAPPA